MNHRLALPGSVIGVAVRSPVALRFNRALWDDQDAYVEIWLEKDALAGVLVQGGHLRMHGNVAEWCHDAMAAYPAGEVRGPTGPSGSWASRVMRGGRGSSRNE